MLPFITLMTMVEDLLLTPGDFYSKWTWMNAAQFSLAFSDANALRFRALTLKNSSSLLVIPKINWGSMNLLRSKTIEPLQFNLTPA